MKTTVREFSDEAALGVALRSLPPGIREAYIITTKGLPGAPWNAGAISVHSFSASLATYGGC
jgi:hypothetical protein